MIYFIKSESGHVKIGFARDSVEFRMKSLQCGCPFKLSLLKTIEGGKPIEFFIHSKFGSNRAQGEWFILDDNLQSFIDNPVFEFNIQEKSKLKGNISYFVDTEKIKELLSTARKPTNYLSAITNISSNTIHNLMNKKHRASGRTVAKISKALGVTETELVIDG